MPNLFRYAVGSIERGLVAHPVLLAIFPVLFLWSHNIGTLPTASLPDIALPIAVSGGGALVSDDQPLLERAHFLANQAQDPAPHYEHSELGFNYRLSNLLAAVGRGQLRHLSERVDTKRSIFERYVEGLGELPGFSFMPEAPYGRSTRWLTTLTIDAGASGISSDELRRGLEAAGIESRPVWKPMHLQPLFADYTVFGGGVAQHLFDIGLCLPSGVGLSLSDQERVIAEVRKLVDR